MENLVWNESARENGFDEVVLLNEKGEVSECTSANIFAVFGTRMVTPPLATSGCLPGVTRALLLEEIKVEGMQVEEGVLTPAELENCDVSFITSTTRDLLPIKEIDHKPMPQNTEAMSKLINAFRQYRARYVSSHGSVPHLFMKKSGFPCPQCGSGDIRRSHRQSWLEVPKTLAGIYAFRCLTCGERFFGNVWILATGGNANCPRCLRLDLEACLRKDLELTSRQRLMLGLGAKLYRCVPCRLNFVSFRKLNHPAA